MPKFCGQCGYEPPCIYGKCLYDVPAGEVVWMPKGTKPRKEIVLRCPNADDSCTYPQCNHAFPSTPKETPMPDFNFNRKTSGDPLASIKDIVKVLTFDEMVRMAQGLNVKPEVINDWARGTQTWVPTAVEQSNSQSNAGTGPAPAGNPIA